MGDILFIEGMEPNREGEYPVCHQVGINGVTAIVQESYNPEPYCSRVYYLVMKGNHLHERMNDSAVGRVQYKPENTNEG